MKCIEIPIHKLSKLDTLVYSPLFHLFFLLFFTIYFLCKVLEISKFVMENLLTQITQIVVEASHFFVFINFSHMQTSNLNLRQLSGMGQILVRVNGNFSPSSSCAVIYILVLIQRLSIL